jgi:hypothetical protein
MTMGAGIAQGIGAAVNAIGAINAGNAGRQASGAFNAAQGNADNLYGQMAGQGLDLIGELTSGYGQYQNPALAGQIQNRMYGAADGLANNNRATAWNLNNQGLAGQAAGMLGGGYQNNVNMPGQGPLMQYQAPGMDQYDFQGVQSFVGQSVQSAMQAGDRARVGARENLAGQSGQMGAGLDAAMADRGMSRDSGAAAGAMSQFGVGATQSMAGLERDISNQVQQAGLMGAQLDSQNALGLAGMGSQYNLGMNDLTQRSGLAAFGANLGAMNDHWGQGLSTAQLQAGIDQGANNFRLGAATGLSGLQGMQNDVTMAQGGLRNAAYTDPLNLMQGVYQQNYLNPAMQGMQQMGSMAGNMLAAAIPGMESGLDRRERGVQTAASGKGAGTGAALGMGNQLGGTITGKNTPKVANPGNPMPQFGVKAP